MNQNWINPKIIVGPTATGDFYYPRPHIENNIWEEIHKGSHVLLAAPRRVGKTSVMVSMMGHCPTNTQCVFKNIQGVQTEDQFYKQFFEALLECLNKFQKGLAWIKDWLKHVNITEIGKDGVKFGDKKPINYPEEINTVLLKLSESKVKIVILLDELPEVLNNLYRKGHIQEAKGILDNLRMWRQNIHVRDYFHLVLAGSVGIHHIVKMIEGRTADINDFTIVDFDALTYPEAEHYVEWATKDATVQYDASMKTHLLSKINYFIPYFINLMLDEINKEARKVENPIIAATHIDAAFEKVVKNSDHFKEWKNRIFDYFPKPEADFLYEVLVFIAHRNKIDKRQLYNLAVHHKLQNSYMELVLGLEHDGYITEQDEHYVYISPFLKAFWKKDNPIYDGN
jgi:uncharacterized protein